MVPEEEPFLHGLACRSDQSFSTLAGAICCHFHMSSIVLRRLYWRPAIRTPQGRSTTSTMMFCRARPNICANTKATSNTFDQFACHILSLECLPDSSKVIIAAPRVNCRESSLVTKLLRHGEVIGLAMQNFIHWGGAKQYQRRMGWHRHSLISDRRKRSFGKLRSNPSWFRSPLQPRLWHLATTRQVLYPKTASSAPAGGARGRLTPGAYKEAICN